MSFGGESGGDNSSRVNEALKLMERLAEINSEELESREVYFLDSMHANYKKYAESWRVSPRQLFWLRDLVEKYNA